MKDDKLKRLLILAEKIKNEVIKEEPDISCNALLIVFTLYFDDISKEDLLEEVGGFWENRQKKLKEIERTRQ